MSQPRSDGEGGIFAASGTVLVLMLLRRGSKERNVPAAAHGAQFCSEAWRPPARTSAFASGADGRSFPPQGPSPRLPVTAITRHRIFFYLEA